MSSITPVCAKGSFPPDDNCMKSSLLMKTRLSVFRVSFNLTLSKSTDFLKIISTVSNREAEVGSPRRERVWKCALTVFCSHSDWDSSRTHFHKADTELSSSVHAEEKLDVWMAFNSLVVPIVCAISSEAHRTSGAHTHSPSCFCKDLFSVCPAIVNLNPLTSRCSHFIQNKMSSLKGLTLLYYMPCTAYKINFCLLIIGTYIRI